MINLYKRFLTFFALLVLVISISSTSTYSSEFTCKQNKKFHSLINQITNGSLEIRENAIRSLLSTGKDSLQCLEKGLLNESEEIACACSNAIAELGLSGIDSYIRFLKNGDYKFLNLPRHQCVFDGLNRIGPEVIPQILDLCVSDEDDYHPMTFQVFISLIKKFEKSATPYLIEATKIQNPKLQHLSLLIQKKIKDESFIPTATSLLNSNNYAVKIEAAWTLGFLGKNAETALPSLIRLLRTENGKVRKLEEPFNYFRYESFKNELIKVITKIDHERNIAVSHILPLTDDEDPETRRLTILYLNNSKIDHELKLKKIIKLTSDPNLRVRAEAIKSLKSIGGDKEFKLMIVLKALEDPYGIVRKEALDTLLNLDGSSQLAAQKVLGFLDDDDPSVQIKALSEIHRFKDSSLVFTPRLIDKINDPGDEIKKHVLIAIGKIKSPNQKLFNSSIKCLSSQNLSVKLAAIDAIKNTVLDASSAIPKLKNIILNEQLSLRPNAFNALKTIGPASEEALLDLLKNENPEIRELAVRSIGDIKPKLHSSTPYLLKIFHYDQEIKVRQAAAISLGKIGAVGEQAILSICDALDSGDLLQISSAFQAITSIGSSATCAIPKLIKLINGDDISISKEAIKTLGIFQESASEGVPTLIEIIDSGNSDLLHLAIKTSGIIGPNASLAISSLIKELGNNSDSIVSETVRTLGKIGYQSYPAIPALISLLEKNDNLREDIIETLVKIATGSRDSGAVERIDDIKIILNALKKYPDLNTPKYEKGEYIKAVARSLEFLELSAKGSIFDRIIAWQKKRHWSIIAIEIFFVLYCLWIGILHLIWLLKPNLIPVIHNSLAGIEIGLKRGFMETKMPIRRFLYLNNLLSRKRVLDSWVKLHLSSARKNFQNKQTVKQRETHVDLPVEINGTIKNTLSVKDIKSQINTEICSILIHGEGGSGKTHLACQIAISCMNRDKNTSLFNHPSIPIIIEDEVSNTDNPQEDVMSAISGQLRQTIASPNKIPYPLLIRLIESRRVLIIVDHFSEMNKSTTVALNKLFETSVINGLIVTSRIEEKLSDSPLVKIIPLRLKKGHLRHFFDAYFRKCGKIELFDDLEFGKLLNRLSKLVGNRDITVLLCKLYADQLIAFKSGQLDNLPKNIPELVLQYLNELNRNITNERLSDMVIHNHAKKIAWLSIKQSFRSSPVSLEEVLNSLGANHQNDIIHYFKDKLHIIKTIEPSKDKIKFVLDPIAEYLAGMHIVENFSQIDWNTLLDRINSSKDELNKAKGFLFALIDCCKADHVESDIPDDVLNALEKHI